MHHSIPCPILVGFVLTLSATTVTGQDCNSNGVPDAEDISSGMSADCDANERPDECDRHFGISTVATAIEGPLSIFASDLDGDGDKDALSASNYATSDSMLAWYENQDGLGRYGSPQIITTQQVGVRSVFSADLDGDGDGDVLSASHDLNFGGMIAWFENEDGQGAFGSLQVILEPADDAWSVFAADLDGDGDFDAISASLGMIAWHENIDGQGTFGTPAVITESVSAPRCVFAIDLDGDGDNDVLSASAWDDKIAWYENIDGAGVFSDQMIITQELAYPLSVFAADLDGDGDHDVLSVSFDEDLVVWFENEDGAGTFGPQRVIAEAADRAASVVAADLDGDGDNDVASASAQDDKIAWYENEDGLGLFGPQRVVDRAADCAWCVSAADLDGDGDSDLLAAVFEDDSIRWYENEEGPGAFSTQQLIASEVVSSVFASDLDGDGDNDVLSASSSNDRVSWYRNENGTGSFGPQQIISVAIDGGVFVFSADLDGDGDNDVLSAADTVAWYENENGSGRFGSQQIIAEFPDGARDVFAVDLDGDRDIDVLSVTPTTVSWFRNEDGLGAFGPAQAIGGAVSAQCVFAADLDSDGDNDVLSASSAGPSASTIHWYRNENGGGLFSSAELITTAVILPTDAFAADLDGDHDNDVLSASWKDGKIACYEKQDGMGTFGPQRVITLAAVGASSVVASDVDGDGDLDVLSASWADDKIAWYQNQDGAGSFGSQQVISALATGASAVFAVDLNGDGQRDVLTAPSWSDELAWYPLCYFDCNANGIPDDRDIAGQGSTDQDRNGVPDECEACAGLADCADSNGDGIRDVACAWYECTGGACVATDRSSQADLGDLSGACPPDGACDGGDRFHVLNCFSNKDTMGAPPYPCEEHAPVALNADAGGVAACMLDGVCDGNDAFHALNCFSNVWFDGGIGYQCLCGPAPSAAPAPVRPQEQAALALKAPTNARPGALITVDVHLQGSLKALRGYQLHLASTGGSGGAPELVDILVDTERRDHALASAQGVWSAFNLNVAQVLVGMDAPEGVPAPAGAYLATFVYRLPQGAPDTCMVELRYEGQSPNPADRTFLFGAYGRSIAVDPVSRSAAQIQVLQARPRHAWD